MSGCLRKPTLSRLAGLVLLAVGLLAPSAAAQSDCTVPGQNAFVRNTLQDIYLWYRELPDPNPALFDAPEAYLEAVRYRPLDSSFSYITTAASSDAFYSDSQYIGFGFAMKLVAENDLRVTESYPDGPAFAAGMRRGHRIMAVNGRPVEQLLADGSLNAELGPSEIGVTARVTIRDLEGNDSELALVKRLVTIPTVSYVQAYDLPGGARVGYIVFRNFVQPSVAALDSAFAQLAEAGATELVLDLRYNGGGLVSVAQHLGGLIGGEVTAGHVFTRFVHNDKNSYRDTSYTFPQPGWQLGLTRLVVITTGASASASELVINAIRPFLPVTVVGDNSYGKPVGQYGFRFCSKILFPVAFSTRNAADEGDYFGGFVPDCPAPDDVLHAYGDPEEASLRAALEFVQTGRCSAEAAAQARARRLPLGLRQPWEGDGWRRLVGAY